MHILVVPSWYPANGDDISVSFIREQAHALVRYGGHQVGVVFPQLSPRFSLDGISGLRGIEAYQDDGVSTYRSTVLNWFRRIPYLGAEIWIREGMRLFSKYMQENGRPDIIHAHVMFYGGLLAQRISDKYSIPFVITEHNSGYARGFVKPWQLALGAKAIKSASARIAVGEKFADLLDRVYKLPSGSWKFIPNMVSKRFFEPSINVSQNSTNYEFYFCTICTLNSNKGVDILIKAFTQSFLNQKRVRLVIGGEGPDRLALERLAESTGVSGQVSFLGKLSREQVVNVIASSDAFVLSSHYETFGIVLVEALALGKPVVATRCGGPESIVRPSDGLLAEKDNITSLANAMKMLFSLKSEFNAEQIRASCLSRYSAPVVIKQLTTLYDQIKLRAESSTVGINK